MRYANLVPPIVRYTPPQSPEAAIEQFSVTVKFYTKAKPEDMTEAYTNGPRMCSAKHPTVLLVATPVEDANFSSYSSDDAPHTSELQQYSLLVGATHAAMDGVGTHIVLKQLTELLGGVSSCTGGIRTNKELFQLLEQEWTLRYGGAHVFQAIPPSTEERASLQDTPQARADFREDQARYIVSSKFFSQLVYAESFTTKGRSSYPSPTNQDPSNHLS
jgi:hypothetical protein